MKKLTMFEALLFPRLKPEFQEQLLRGEGHLINENHKRELELLKMNHTIIKAKDVAELLSITKSTVYTWAKKGFIPHIKLGSSYLFSREKIIKLINQSR